jgi:hypothetical protein
MNMEDTKKLYSQKAIGIATFFGGPLAAGYLVKKNYQSLGLESHGKKAFIIGIVSTLLLFAGVFSIPEHILDKIPNALIPAIYTGIIYLIVERLQGQDLKEPLENGRAFQSAWKAVGVGAISMLILLIFIATTAFIAADLSKTTSVPKPEPKSETVRNDIDFDSFFDNKATTGKSTNHNLSFRQNLKADEIGIKYPKEVGIGEDTAIELISTKSSLTKIKLVKLSSFEARGTSLTSNVMYKDGVRSGTYTKRFNLSFNTSGEYEINESWFENLPEDMRLRSERIKVK